MLDAFLEHPFFLNRHRQAPLLKERESFLNHLQQQGTKQQHRIDESKDREVDCDTNGQRGDSNKKRRRRPSERSCGRSKNLQIHICYPLLRESIHGKSRIEDSSREIAAYPRSWRLTGHSATGHSAVTESLLPSWLATIQPKQSAKTQEQSWKIAPQLHALSQRWESRLLFATVYEPAHAHSTRRPVLVSSSIPSNVCRRR
jgi:hypothetical protein